jgi:hypothetical protein
VLVLCKIYQALPKYTRTTFAQNKKFYPQNVFWGRAQAGCGDVTSLYKNLVKNWKTNFPRQAIQEPIFLWLKQILKAVAMGVVAACGIFLSDRPNPVIAKS